MGKDSDDRPVVEQRIDFGTGTQSEVISVALDFRRQEDVVRERVVNGLGEADLEGGGD